MTPKKEDYLKIIFELGGRKKKVSNKHYRAKAVLSNGVDMPITIVERDDDYIYVTLAPLSNLLD